MSKIKHSTEKSSKYDKRGKMTKESRKTHRKQTKSRFLSAQKRADTGKARSKRHTKDRKRVLPPDKPQSFLHMRKRLRKRKETPFANRKGGRRSVCKKEKPPKKSRERRKKRLPEMRGKEKTAFPSAKGKAIYNILKKKV